MTRDEIIKILKSKDLSITKNRITIIKCLEHSTHFHSINEIIKHNPNINFKSVYNNIKILVDKGLIDTYSFSGNSKFALADSLKSQNEIHLISNDINVTHLTINKNIFDDIENEIIKNNHKVKNIKIFVEIE